MPEIRVIQLRPVTNNQTAGYAVTEKTTWLGETDSVITLHSYQPSIANYAYSFIFGRLDKGLQAMNQRSGLVQSINWLFSSLGTGKLTVRDEETAGKLIENQPAIERCGKVWLLKTLDNRQRDAITKRCRKSVGVNCLTRHTPGTCVSDVYLNNIAAHFTLIIEKYQFALR